MLFEILFYDIKNFNILIINLISYIFNKSYQLKKNKKYREKNYY